MRIAYLDMFSGVSGDMLLGACLDAGVDIERLRAAVAALDIEAVSISAERVERHGIIATRCSVEVPDMARDRSLSDILERIEASGLVPTVAARARAVFERLAEAEASVHGVSVEDVHFHEVGALDAIVDIVGVAWCFEALGIDRLYASRFTLGSGWTETAHGRMPVPPPAVMELVSGWQVVPGEVDAELTTPTGAAVVTTLAEEGWPPDFVPSVVGYGAGTREFAAQPNLLRLLIGRSAPRVNRVEIVETDLDDLDPRLYAPLAERLYAVGALEVHRVPIHMKKDRPGVTVRVLTTESAVEAVESVLFEETTTIGVRRWAAQRTILERDTLVIETAWGPVAVKRVRRRDGRIELRPEFDACRAIARQHGLPVRDVLAAVTGELERLEPDPDPAV